MTRKRRYWHSSYEKPRRKGWYLCKARDDLWHGQRRYRAWGNGTWWIKLIDGWISSPMGLYQWRGPAFDVMKDSPPDPIAKTTVEK